MGRWLLKLLVTVALLLTLFHLLDLSIADMLGCITHWGFIAFSALLPLSLIPLIAANRWRYLLRLSGIEERLAVLWGLSWKALFLGLFLPGSQGLDFFRILFIERRHPGSRGIAGSTVVVERMIGFLLLGLFTLAAILLVTNDQHFSVVFALVLAVNGLLWLLVLTVFLVRWREPVPAPAGLARVFSRAVRYLHRLHTAVQGFPYRRGLLPTVLWIGAFQLALVAVVHLLFIAFGHPLPFIRHLLFYPLIGMLTVVPVTVSGFGVREGAFVYFYGLVGIPAEVAVGVSLVNYLLVIGIPALLGGVLLLFTGDPYKESQG